MRFIHYVFLLFLCSAELVLAQTESDEKIDTKTDVQFKKPLVDIQSELQSRVEDLTTTLKDTVGGVLPQASSSAEKRAKPLTNWVEKKLQSNKLLKSSAQLRQNDNQPTGERTLREAILLARAEFSGSVLSAKRVRKGDKTSFNIKILSETGVLRMITIDALMALPVSPISVTQDSE